VKQPAKRSINRICRSVAPSSIAPASEVIVPPSKAATTFRPSTGAKPNRSALHSVCIGAPSGPELNRLYNTIFSDLGPRCTYPFEKSRLGIAVLHLNDLGGHLQHRRDCQAGIGSVPHQGVGPDGLTDRGFGRPYEISYRGLKLPRVSAALGRSDLWRGADC